SLRRPTPDELRRLGVDAAAGIVHLVVLHRAGERPFCLEERLINIAAVPEAAAETFAQTAPGPWLIGRVPWSAAEHRIRAVNAGRQTADLLQLKPGTACLIVERRTWNRNEHVTHVTLTYPGDHHELVARFTPSA